MSDLLQKGSPGQFEADADIGPFDRPGSWGYDPEQQVHTLTAPGGGKAQASFHYAWKRMQGDFIVTMQVRPPVVSRLGWMVRTGLDAGAAQLTAGLEADGMPSLQFQSAAASVRVELPVPGAEVIQLERQGNTCILSAARYGEPFQALSLPDLDLGGEVHVGLFICAGSEPPAARAEFCNVRLVVPARDGFDPWRERPGSLLEVMDLPSGLRRVIYSTGEVIEAPNWTRDGRALIYNSGGRLFRFDLLERKPERIDTGEIVRNNNDHVLSFDGSMLAISSHTPDEAISIIYTVPAQGGAPRRVTPRGPSYLHGWSPDGRFLVYTGERGGSYDIYRIPVEGGEETRLTDTLGLDDGPEYTPDGLYVYFNSVRSGRMQIWRMKPDGGGQEHVTDDVYNNWFPHVSPDGKWVVFLSYLVGEVEPSDHPPARRVYLRCMPLEGGTPRVIAYLYGGQGTMNVPSWSPDGRQLAFVSNTARQE